MIDFAVDILTDCSNPLAMDGCTHGGIPEIDESEDDESWRENNFATCWSFFRENEINYEVGPCKKTSCTYYFERVLRVIKSCGKSGLVATAAHMANLKLSSVGSGLWSILHWPQFYKGGNGRSKETPISQKTMTWNPACLKWHLVASGEIIMLKLSVQ